MPFSLKPVSPKPVSQKPVSQKPRRWPRSLTRTLLITFALAAATGFATYLVRHEQPTRIGCPIADERSSGKTFTFLALTFKEFHPAGNQFSGTLSVEVAPNTDRMQPEAIQKWSADLKKVVLRINHYDGHTLSYQGGTDSPVALAFPPAWGSLMGKGTFIWNAEAASGPFFYPFDRYTLHLNPSLMEVTDPAVYPNVLIDTFETDFANSNFIPHLNNIRTQYPNDPYEILLDRPLMLRSLAIIVGVLLIFWLFYLIRFAKPGEQAGQLVSLFVGVFSIRSSLLSGAPLFPSLIDFCAIGVYLAAVLIVLVRWTLPDHGTTECPYCKSQIPLGANVCCQCTRPVNTVPLPD